MNIEDFVRIAPATWPGRSLDIQPGDLSYFAPQGIGISGPFPIRPWDDPFGPSPAPYYAYQERTGHPVLDAPTADAAGGVVYFNGSPDGNDVAALLRLLEVRADETQFAAFLDHASNTLEQRYVTQLRFVGRFALASMFGASIEGEAATLFDQKTNLGDAVWKFIECEQARWGTGMGGNLSGVMGGDGDWAKESLAFGFMVENGYQGVYRIWSRAWLVTK